MSERTNISSQQQTGEDQALVGLLARFRKMSQEEQEATLSCYRSFVEQISNGIAMDDVALPEMTPELARQIVGPDGGDLH